MYECQSVEPDNKCKSDHEFLDVLSKEAHGFTQDNLHELKEHLNAACVLEDEMQLSSHHGKVINLKKFICAWIMSSFIYLHSFVPL